MIISPFFIFFGFICIVGICAYFSWAAAKKRREGMAAVAASLGMRYRQEKDRGLATQYKFIDALRQGSNHYAFNIISGTYKDQSITTFDYHYETHSTDSKGRRQTHHHHFSFFTLILPAYFPELKISKEGLFSKIAQTLGYDDIDFESHEFSKKFCVRSKDKKFAYDVCNARMIEFLLQNQDFSIEIEGNVLAMAFTGRLAAEQIQPNLDRLVSLRTLMPDYLFEGK